MSRPYGEPLSTAAELPDDGPAPLPDPIDRTDEPPVRRGLLMTLLRLRHVQPSGWQRVVLGDLPPVLGVLLVLADLCSAWVILALPAAVWSMVLLHEVLAGRLSRLPAVEAAPAGRAPAFAAPTTARPKVVRGSRG